MKCLSDAFAVRHRGVDEGAEGRVGESAATSHNNVVGACARLRRAPGYTARRLWRRVDGEDMGCQSKAESRSCLAPRRQPPNVIRHSFLFHIDVGARGAR
jgi:hypothetical protein